MSKKPSLLGFYRPHERVYAPLDYENSLTRAEFQEECDINVLMRKYQQHGVISHVMTAPPRYGDFVGVPDFREALDIVNRAQAAFMALPAEARKEFENDPAKFNAYVDGLDDYPDDRDARIARLRAWGLVDVPQPEAPPMKVEVINPAPPVVPADK